MPTITQVWMAGVTQNSDNAGTDDPINVSINVDGTDVLNGGLYDEAGGHLPGNSETRQAQGFLFKNAYVPFSQFASEAITNSSIRIGISGENAWKPQDVFVFGESGRGTVPLAMETNISRALSAESSDNGLLTLPIRMTRLGSNTMPIRRLLLAMSTKGPSWAGTENPIELQITAGSNDFFHQQIPDTTQADQDRGTANFYLLDAPVPFSRSDLSAGGSIVLSIQGTDAWLPNNLFIFGLDTATSEGRPTQAVSLVSIPKWTLGALSTDDPEEGRQSISLPLALGISLMAA